MNCPWFDHNMFYIFAPGVLLPCCHFPVLKIIVPEEEKEFYKKYSMLYLKNNTIEKMLEDKSLIKELISDLIKEDFCTKKPRQFFSVSEYVKKDFYDFQITLTTKCNLMCLACLRNCNSYIRKQTHQFHWDFDIDEFKKQFNPNFLKRINSIQFTGSIGDAIFYKHLLSLLEYISKHNPYIVISIHTNANTNPSLWWKLLANTLSNFQRHIMVFSIDGLEQTYPIYRVNGDFKRILHNAQTFINAGGTAHWKYIKMKHNECNIEEAKILSEKMGFEHFSLVDPWHVTTEHNIYNQNND